MTFMDVNMVLMFALIIYLLCGLVMFTLSAIVTKYVRLPEKLDMYELTSILTIICTIVLSDLIIPRLLA